MLSEKQIKETFKLLKLDKKLTEEDLPDMSQFLLSEPGELVWFVSDNSTQTEQHER